MRLVPGWPRTCRGRDGPALDHGVDHYTPEVMAANRALQRRLFEGGYAGITWPMEYGGQGLPSEYEWAFVDEAAGYVLPDFGALTITTFYVCVPTMLAYAPPEFLRRFVPRVLAGEELVCQFFSEPSSGSDLAGARTRATRDGEQWILNGQKIWSTFAHLADSGMCLARTDWEVPKHQGLTWFLVPCDAPGLTIRPIKQINEVAEFCEEFFDDVVVPDTQRLCEVNEGWTRDPDDVRVRARRRATRGRHPARGSRAHGTRPRATGPAGRTTRRSGRPAEAGPSSHQRLRRTALWALASPRWPDSAASTPGVASYVKLFRGTYSPVHARLAVEIGGAGAMTWEYADPDGAEPSLTYLRGRGASIAGGTNETQRNVVGERALGLPREPSFDTRKPFSEVLREAKNWTGEV